MKTKCTDSATLLKTFVKLQFYMCIGFVVVLLPLYIVYTLKAQDLVTHQVLLFSVYTILLMVLLYIWYKVTKYLVTRHIIVAR